MSADVTGYFFVSIFTYIRTRIKYKIIDAKRYLAWYRDCFYIDVLRGISLHIKSISVWSEHNA
jgi:hypothetical protein